MAFSPLTLRLLGGCSTRNTLSKSLALASLKNAIHTTATVSLLKGTDEEEDKTFQNPFTKDYGKYEKVLPATVREVKRQVPDGIQKPDYWQSGHPVRHFVSGKIEIKNPKKIEQLKRACSISSTVLQAAAEFAKEGVTTDAIDEFVYNYTIKMGAYPSPLNYKGFPKSVCTSVNNVACHGVPDDRPLRDGDIINIDVMAYIDGCHGDCSTTVMIGNVDEPGRKLVKAAKTCLIKGIMVCGPGVPFQRIGQTIQKIAEDEGVTVVPCFTGHGIGEQVHALPDIYHFDYPYPGTMEPGMAFTVEPVLTQGLEDIVILEDGWTAVTIDGARCAQFEHTILVTHNGVEILTLPQT